MTPESEAKAREAYAENVRRFPTYGDGRPRQPWDELCDVAKACWLDPTWELPAPYRSEMTPEGEQLVIPGCEKDDPRTGARQLSLF